MFCSPPAGRQHQSDHAHQVTRRDLVLATVPCRGTARSGHPSTAFQRIYNSPWRRSATMPSVPVELLATKDSRSHSPDAFGIADYVKLDDLVIDDSERHDAVRLSIERDDDTGGTVDQRWNEHRSRIGAEARLTSDSRRTADDDGRSSAARAEVGPQHDVRVQHGDQRVEVTTASCQEEGVDNCTLTSEVGIRYFGAPYPTSRPARELPGRRRGSIDHRSDLLEWQVEHVMENEGQALSGSERVQNDEESETDRVGKECLVLGSKFSHWTDDRIREMHLQALFASVIACSQHIQTNAGHDRRQPSTKVLDVVGLGPADSKPGILDCVIGLGERSQHPIGDGSKLCPLLFEALCQPVVLVHHAHPR